MGTSCTELEIKGSETRGFSWAGNMGRGLFTTVGFFSASLSLICFYLLILITH